MTRRRPEPRLTVPAAFEQMRTDYAAGRISRFTRRRHGVAPEGASGDYHFRSESDFLRAMEYARDMDRNDHVVSAILDRTIANVLQGGIGFDVQSGDERLDAELWAELNGWATEPDACDASGRFTLDELAALLLRAVYVDGGAFVALREDDTLQVIEAHRCRTPGNTRRPVVHGVLLDEDRRPVEYWFTRDDVGLNVAVQRVAEMQSIPARNAEGEPVLLHVYDPKRFSQTRGITAFAPVFDMLGMFEDINFAKLVQQQIVSCFAIFRERTMPMPPAASGQYGVRSEEALGDGARRIVEEIAPGMEIQGQYGEKLIGFSPDVPNPEYFEHAKLTLQLICACVNLPVISLLLDGRETNFSGWRGAIDQAKIGWRRHQRIVVGQRFLLPVLRWRIRRKLAADKALARLVAAGKVDPFNILLRYPRWPYIQPKDDIEAAALEVDKRLTSPRRQHAERGQDYEEVIAELVADNAFALRVALRTARQLQAEFGIEIDPRQLLNLNPQQPLRAEPAAPSSPSPAAEQNARALAFKQRIVELLLTDGTMNDAVANALNWRPLLEACELPINPEYIEPYFPVRDDMGAALTGEVIVDEQGDIVGGAATAPAPAAESSPVPAPAPATALPTAEAAKPEEPDAAS